LTEVQKNTKEIIINHRGTRMAEDGHGVTNKRNEKFRLNFSNRSTVTVLL